MTIKATYFNGKSFEYKLNNNIMRGTGEYSYNKIKILNCSNNGLHELPLLPSLLQKLYCSYNELTSCQIIYLRL